MHYLTRRINRLIKRPILALSGTAMLLACLATHAQAPAIQPTPAAPPAKPCESEEYRQFDFWLGQWDVYLSNGKTAGASVVQSFADGCALLENWSGTGGFTGKSINIYDITDKKWHQSWVDNSGSRLSLEGGYVDGKMVLWTDAPNPNKAGAVLRQQITWSKNTDGSVRQLWQTSEDAGNTWSTAFDGKYVRRK
ncbi:hypothetical protein [Undibacterium sp.]|uniref:hypothetical protein n=1 Tax=Undibacterium sp. TaxID=1914977 RepID=UPI00374CBA76